MNRILSGVLVLLGAVLYCSQTYADTNMETPLVSKTAACSTEDGSHPDRLEITSYGKSGFATGYLKQNNALYYVVPNWKYNLTETERTLTRVTLYSYDCSTKKIAYFPPNFMERFPTEMKWQDAMWGYPRPIFDYSSQNTYGWRTFAVRVLQKEGNLFLLAVCARDHNCEWEGYYKRIVYDTKSGRTVTVPALLGSQYSVVDTGSYEWVYLDIVPGKIRIAEEYYTDGVPYPAARDTVGQYRILYEYSFATRKLKQVGREDGPFYYSEYNMPLFGMYEDRPPVK